VEGPRHEYQDEAKHLQLTDLREGGSTVTAPDPVALNHEANDLLERLSQMTGPFDSVAFARISVDMIRCARRMRIAAAEVAGTDPKAAADLLVGAMRLEHELPIDGLTSLCVTGFDIHPADLEFLLLMHIHGQNDGVVGKTWLDADLRGLPWVRYVVPRDSSYPGDAESMGALLQEWILRGATTTDE